jgi:hypothetical protein
MWNDSYADQSIDGLKSAFNPDSEAGMGLRMMLGEELVGSIAA